MLSSPGLCLISFLCLDLYVLRDDTSISQGHSFQSGIYLFWSASEVGDEVVAVGMFGPPGGFLADRSGAVLLFVDPFLLFVFVCHTVLSAPCGLVVACWERGLTSWLSLYVIFSCDCVTFPYSVLGQMWYFIVSIPD